MASRDAPLIGLRRALRQNRKHLPCLHLVKNRNSMQGTSFQGMFSCLWDGKKWFQTLFRAAPNRFPRTNYYLVPKSTYCWGPDRNVHPVNTPILLNLRQALHRHKIRLEPETSPSKSTVVWGRGPLQAPHLLGGVEKDLKYRRRQSAR